VARRDHLSGKIETDPSILCDDFVVLNPAIWPGDETHLLA